MNAPEWQGNPVQPKRGLLDTQLGTRLQAMAGFRNIAVHNYREISMTVLRSILEKHLGDFREYSRVIVAMAYR
ncbi:MAG: DUF86 domain-containing protein [Pseudomonadota bacterium]